MTRELVVHAVATAPMTLDVPANRSLITLLAERLAEEPDAPLQLSIPTDPAALEVATFNQWSM